MAGIERRDTHNPRIRLGGLPVELVEDDLPGGFEADAHDIGVGGVGVRSAFLPKLGSRLHVRLISPEDGRPIEASGEVVWRDDSAAHEGSFGLRFDSMDGASAEELARIIEGQRYAPGSPAIEAMGLGEPGASIPGSEVHPPMMLEPRAREHVDLYLDGVGDSLDALLVHDGGDLVTLEQSLDFLTLGRGAALGDGRRGEIASIELHIERGLPRLSITLRFAESAESSQKAREEIREDGAEDEFHEASHIFAKEIRTSSAGELESVVEPLFGASGLAQWPEDEAPSSRSAEFAERGAELAYDAPRNEPGAMSATGVPASSHEDPLGELADEAAEAAFFAQAPYKGTWVERPGDDRDLEQGGALVELRRLVLRARLSAADRYQEIKPHLERFMIKARARSLRLFGSTFSAVMGVLRAFLLRSRHFISAFARRLLDRPALGELGSPSASKRPRRQQGAPEVPMASRKRSRSQLVIGLGVLLALIAGIGWMIGGDGPATDADAESAGVLRGELAAGLDAGPSEPLRGAPRLVDSSVAFGAESIDGAMVFELTLEGEPLTIRGEQRGESVRVHIPEARALSRAGVIAANHPDIEYASIRNLEDGAELELRLVPGREPAYRVELRGLTLRVLLSP